jgi:diguanylate cyclase (GGDEF)-like protein/PAS domain S-box-containing protein
LIVSLNLALEAGVLGLAALCSLSGTSRRFLNERARFLPEEDGLRELLPEADYERLLAELDAAPAPGEAATGTVILDREWKIQSADGGMAEITGYTTDELTGMRIVSLGDDGQREEMIRGLRMVSESVVPSYCSEYRLIRKDRSPVWLRCCSSRVDARDDAHQILVVSEDITADVAARERLSWQSAHDSLTGLPNRARFVESLQNAIRRAEAEDRELALICLDLDGFKAINCSMGRAAGDAILRQVADRLRESLERPDPLVREIPARISGDKFAVIVRGADSTDGPARLAERLLAVFVAPFRLGEHEFPLSANAGISRYPRDGQEPDTLLQSAKAAMEDAKRAGHNRYSFCTPGLKNDVSERLLLGNRLGKAIADGEMYADFQPQYEVAGNRLVGFEALCRWHSADLGEVTPARFIPAAEESGLIVPIGQFVLREACLRAVDWQTGLAPVRVAVNVSAVQFGRADFVESVLTIVRETGLDARLLELELTESSLLRNREESAKKMVELRAFGIRIAIDDFGTGYSSLSYLQSMPVDTLKVDQTFTSRIGRSSSAVTMVRAIIAMAHALELRVVTEGVETGEQAEILRQLGTDEVQGDLYGHPETAEAARERVWRELNPKAIHASPGGGLGVPAGVVEAAETVQ